jgi:uncharacterized Zn finger protein
MPYIETGQFPSTSRDVRSQCPDCPGSLAVLRVMDGRAGSQYWALRCISCGGIHLDIVNPHSPTPGHDGASAA